jgi:hypothetical protein
LKARSSHFSLLVRDLAISTDKTKREMYDRLYQHFNQLEVEKAMRASSQWE